MSKILVNEIGTWTGTEIALVSGRFLTGTASQFKITGGTAGQALITDGSGGLTFGDAGSSFPTQTGQAGKFLTTDGTTATWEAVDALPSQTGQAGEFLQTDGTTATWEPAGGAAYDTEASSTGYLDVPSGTTAQRPSSPATGNMRWNTDNEALEHYSGSAGGWVQWAGAAPTITSISPTTAPTTGTSVTVTGINFQAGSLIKLIGNDSTVYNAASTSYVSSTEVSFTTPVLPVANEPYDVKLVLPAGGFFVFPDALDAGGTPTWTTAAGSLGEISNFATGTHFTLVAVDPDGLAVTYSTDTANTAILTTAGLTLNSTTGAITGDPVDVSTSTVYSFDVTATDTGGNTTTRSFSITVSNFFAGATGGTITTYMLGGVNYKVHTFLSGATFSAGDVGGKADILVVGGGGGGGGDNGGAGGAGGMIVYTDWTIAGGTNPTDNYTITIGGGGSGTSGYHSNDNAAGSSTVFGVGRSEWNGTTGDMLTAVGGGRGATGDSGGASTDYGGGGSHGQNPTAGYTDPGSTIQGYSGGYSTTDEGGGGGGGASENGGDATTSIGGVGGDGLENAFRTGSNVFYAGGGGGGESQNSSGQQAAGGAGGGGAGWEAGTANTGGGGGGGRQASTNGQAGGTGIVVIRYIIS